MLEAWGFLPCFQADVGEALLRGDPVALPYWHGDSRIRKLSASVCGRLLVLARQVCLAPARVERAGEAPREGRMAGQDLGRTRSVSPPCTSLMRF